MGAAGGDVCEREQSFEDAPESFESAWDIRRKVGPRGRDSGWRFALLKSKRHVECIDVCKMVLDKHPDYPKIRKDILLKAQMAIRP